MTVYGALRHVLADEVAELSGKIERDLDRHKPDDAARHRLEATSTINPVLLLHRLWLDAHRDDLATALRAVQLRAVAAACANVPDELLDALHTRRHAATNALVARHPGWTRRRVLIEPMWRLVVGHGEDSVHDTSLTLSPTYGLPILPGTALKGLAASAAAENGWTKRDTILFGVPRPHQPSEAHRGSVLIWDALPTRPPTLVLDVLTPHVKDYYDTANTTGTPTEVPAEYHNPVPIRFLAVEKTPFRSYLIGSADDVRRCGELISRGLDELGIGGKTAAGYGYCNCHDEEQNGKC